MVSQCEQSLKLEITLYSTYKSHKTKDITRWVQPDAIVPIHGDNLEIQHFCSYFKACSRKRTERNVSE